MTLLGRKQELVQTPLLQEGARYCGDSLSSSRRLKLADAVRLLLLIPPPPINGLVDLRDAGAALLIVSSIASALHL
jgi:hypothetical protein